MFRRINLEILGNTDPFLHAPHPAAIRVAIARHLNAE